MFKCLNRQAPSYLCDQFTLQSDLHTSMTENSVFQLQKLIRKCINNHCCIMDQKCETLY